MARRGRWSVLTGNAAKIAAAVLDVETGEVRWLERVDRRGTGQRAGRSTRIASAARRALR